MIRRILLFLIHIYQRTLSPDHGVYSARFPYGYCRFQPTCSEYTYEAIQRFGAFRGSIVGIRRILRCHPWAEPNVDPVPDSLH